MAESRQECAIANQEWSGEPDAHRRSATYDKQQYHTTGEGRQQYAVVSNTHDGSSAHFRRVSKSSKRYHTVELNANGNRLRAWLKIIITEYADKARMPFQTRNTGYQKSEELFLSLHRGN